MSGPTWRDMIVRGVEVEYTRCSVCDGSLINQLRRWNCSNIDDASLVASWRKSASLQGQVGWLSRSQIAASWSCRVRGNRPCPCPCSFEEQVALYISSFFNAIMRSQRLLRVRDEIFNHTATFTNKKRLPRHKAYVLSAHAV